MVEGISYRKTPMQEKLPKYFAKKVHWKTSSELDVIELKMIVYKSQGWANGDTGLALEDYLEALEEVAVIEVDWEELLLFCEGLEDKVEIFDCSKNCWRVEDIDLIEHNSHNRIHELLIG